MLKYFNIYFCSSGFSQNPFKTCSLFRSCPMPCFLVFMLLSTIFIQLVSLFHVFRLCLALKIQIFIQNVYQVWEINCWKLRQFKRIKPRLSNRKSVQFTCEYLNFGFNFKFCEQWLSFCVWK